MQIKKTLLAAAVTALVAATAQAQTMAPSGGAGLTMGNDKSSVTLYGLIDVTMSHATAQNASNGSKTSFQTPWFSGNRFGVQGKHDTGGGLNALFKLEAEFVANTGEQDTPGNLFNRDAWIGLQSADLGKLSFGRQNNIARDPAASAVYGDPYGPAKASTEEGGYTNTNNFKQMIYYAAGPASGDAGTANAGKADTRYNRGIVWKKEFGSVIAGFGWQTPAYVAAADGFVKNTSKTATLAYNGADYTIAGFYTSADVAGLSASTASIGGNYQVNPLVRVNAGLFSYGAKQVAVLGGDRKDTAWTLSAKFTPAGKMDYQVGYQVMKATNAALSAAGGTVTNAYADASTKIVTGTGARKTLYGSAFYHLDSTTELYVAADRLSMDAGYGNINGQASQMEYGVGMRLKF
jgi:predicted porin